MPENRLDSAHAAGYRHALDDITAHMDAHGNSRGRWRGLRCYIAGLRTALAGSADV